MSYATLLQLTLNRAPDDAYYFYPEFQAELRQFISLLEKEGVEVSYGEAMFDSATTVGGIVGEFVIPLAGIAGTVIGAALVAWINGRAGRKVRMKVGDIELEASSPAEIDHLVAQALALKAQLAEQDVGR
ncbi:hypothetical protein D3C76_717040 [compost metagenome]